MNRDYPQEATFTEEFQKQKKEIVPYPGIQE